MTSGHDTIAVRASDVGHRPRAIDPASAAQAAVPERGYPGQRPPAGWRATPAIVGGMRSVAT
jgi:hypothetical protein